MTRTEQKQKTRRRLIDTALAQSAEKGVSSLSLREVAKAAGIAPTGFYRHFRDIDELTLVLVDEVALALRQLIREARRRFSEQSNRVTASIEAFMEYVHTKPHLFRVLLGERLGATTAFRRALHVEIDAFVSELADDLEAQAKAAGLPAENAPLAAEAIVAVVFTVGAEALELPRHRHAGLSDRIIREVYLILAGAGVLPSEQPGVARGHAGPLKPPKKAPVAKRPR